MKLEPARTIIDKVGGPRVVAEVVGKDLSRVYRWMYPKARGGTDGVIPSKDAQALLNYASGAGVELSPADFFPPVDHPSEAAQ